MITRRQRRASRGQALVETALVLPLLLLMFFSIIEFGRFMFVYAALNDAIREGTRYAIVHGASSTCPSGPVPSYVNESLNPCYDAIGANVQAAVRRYAFTFAQSSDLSVPLPTWSPNNARGSTVTVNASYVFRTIIPIPLPPITIQGSSTDVVNY